MHLAHSALGRGVVCDRGTHQEIAAAIAARVSERLGLPKREVRLAVVASLIHDQGHPPFSHAGEMLLRSLTADGDGHSFCHDAVLQDLLEYGKTGRAVREAGISVKELQLLLNPKAQLTPDLARVRFIVTEVADRGAYLLTDAEVLRGFGVPADRVERIQRSALDFINDGLVFAHNQFAVKDIGLLSDMLRSRGDVFRGASTSPVAEMVREVICLAGSELHAHDRRRGIHSQWSFAARFRTMRDAEAIAEFPLPYREALGSSFEASVHVLGAWSFGAFRDSTEASLRDMKDRVRFEAFKAGADLRRIIVCSTEDFSKRCRVNVATPNGGVEPRALEYVVPREERLFIAAYLDGDADRRYIERIRESAINTVATGLSHSGKIFGDEILTDQFCKDRVLSLSA